MRTVLSPQDWLQLQEVFDAAVQLAIPERLHYLDDACKDSPTLRRQVNSLLLSLDGDSRLSPVVDSAAADTLLAALPSIGDRLGAYRLTGVVGRGGMGVVYRAIRADDEFEKQVAIKVVGFGFITAELRARFLAERQILANLDHPNIARLLDGGTTQQGLPYVVMEFVEGQPIDDYCSSKDLSRRERLALVVQVARAVEYAHQHLVVHRDLKPDNIHVVAGGIPKLLDFGIAKPLGAEDGPLNAALTQSTDRLLTPDYASPEQWRGDAISTATDVYQLGVLLFVLLTGSPPFEASQARLVEWERLICETPPPHPHLDLDRIILHALEKDPKCRYRSAAALADDLERYLNGYPVVARKPSWIRSTLKFVRRHKLAACAVALGVIALIGVSIAMTVIAKRASTQARIADETSNFLLSIFAANDPYETPKDKVTARDLLSNAEAQLKNTAGQDSVVRVELLDDIGELDQLLGMTLQARDLLSQSLKLRRDKLPAENNKWRTLWSSWRGRKAILPTSS